MKLFKRSQPIQSKFVERYDLGSKLGEGAFSAVHEATRKEDGLKFAAKVIDRSKIKGKSAVQSEVDVLGAVDHENIVKLIEYIEEKKSIYLVLTLITGGELFDRIVEVGMYTEKSAATLVKQILSGVNYLHEKGMVHRDLKPENLLMLNREDDAPVIISDFGLACWVSQSEKMRQTCGTPGYVAPEVLNRKQYTESIDCWAIGVITYILLCGYPPFYAENDRQLYEQIKSAEYEFESPDWDEISTLAKDFINQHLELNVNKRITAKGALSHKWLENHQEINIAPTVGPKLKNFRAKEKWRKAFNVQKALQRFNLGIQGEGTEEENTSSENTLENSEENNSNSER